MGQYRALLWPCTAVTLYTFYPLGESKMAVGLFSLVSCPRLSLSLCSKTAAPATVTAGVWFFTFLNTPGWRMFPGFLHKKHQTADLRLFSFTCSHSFSDSLTLQEFCFVNSMYFFFFLRSFSWFHYFFSHSFSSHGLILKTLSR